MFGKIIISLISAGYCHDSSCPVACQNIISNPNLNRLFRKWVLGICSCKHTTYGFYICHTLTLTSFCGGLHISINGLFLIWRGKCSHQLMLWGQSHKAYTKYGVWPCGKYRYFCVVLFYIKNNCSPYRFPNPIALCFFNRFTPLQSV